MNRSELLNWPWKFTYGDPDGATGEVFDDGDWFDIGLPHSFGMPYFMETEFYVGRGVYRRTIILSDEDVERCVMLEFHGVFQDAEIFVNGTPVDRHLGGYTAFTVDVSAAVHAGANQLAVRVNNEWNPRLAPRAGEHVFNGGIYRDVSLIVAERTRIAWYGTCVTTARLEGERAEVEITTELVNDTDAVFHGALCAMVTRTDGAAVVVDEPVELAPSATVLHRQRITLDEVRRWSPDSPTTYTLDQTLSSERGVPRHAVRTTFGVRTFEFANSGFYLNGERLTIHGANVHQDHAGWSDAVTHSGIRRDVALIKDTGMNLIRGSHYPHHDRFADECDRQGLLFWSEAPFWGIGGTNAEGFWNASAYPPHEADRAEFEESCLRAMAEMIRVNRNHPSIVAWSTGNEVFFSDEQLIPAAKDLTRRLVKLANELDPTRPAAVGGAQRRGFDEIGDLAGYNGDGGELFLEPGRPNLVSEYGSVIEDRPGAYADRYRHGAEIDYPWRSGIVLWCGFHHGSIVPGMGRMGFIDYYRLPLRSWHWYRHALLGIDPPTWPQPGTPTALRLRADRTSMTTDGTEDAHVVVEIINEAGEIVADERPVRIEVIEGGGIFPTGTAIELSPENKGILDGQGAIEFRSYFAGSNLLRATAAGLAPAELTIEAIGGEQWSGQHRKLPTGPPSRAFRRIASGALVVSELRPVFSSGSRADHPAQLITDHSTTKGWHSDRDESGAWLQVDLEGLWQISVIELEFGPGTNTPYLVEISEDGEKLHALASGSTEPSVATIDVSGRRARAVKLTFPRAPAEVRNIRIFSQ